VSPAQAEAERAGIDLSLIELSLSYSYDKRAEQHQAALELASHATIVCSTLSSDAIARLREILHDLHPEHRSSCQKQLQAILERTGKK
jgi:thioredoxin-like negative regulator of GroEL